MTDVFPIVTRRDMLGEACLICEDGRYREEWRLDNEDVACTQCGSVIDRWLTKREVLKLTAKDNS